MNTEKVSFPTSAVGSSENKGKPSFSDVLFELDAVARWLDNGSDSAQAAEQIRMARFRLRECLENSSAARAAGIEAAAQYIDSRAAELKTFGNTIASKIAGVFEDEANAIRGLSSTAASAQ